MSETVIDARGLACPEPVVRARKAITQAGAGTVVVLVDDRDSAENITRMAGTLGWSAASQQAGGEFRLSLSNPAGALPSPQAAGPAAAPPAALPAVVVFVASDQFGTGDEQLGRVLMRAFLKTLKELQPLPACVIFANAGVRLTTQGSDLLDDLRQLQAAGMQILSCGTCLDYYHLKDSLEVGRVSNMFEIASTLAAADRVLRP
jgi:selenium metabolism protein YedF